jgi:mannose-6-phosphate isomerase
LHDRFLQQGLPENATPQLSQILLTISANGTSPRRARDGSGQFMPTEVAAVRAVRKPWGVRNLQPWSSLDGSDDAIGELWFERTSKQAHTPALLVKLLFTSEPLSIQVHPDDTFARAMGMPNGKSEAWYILSAEPDARIGVGLKHQVTPQQLRASIQDGSITELVDWRPIAKHDVIYIPAGTIHSIGAGIVLAEIQQRSEATFRLFDFGRQRELHEDNGVAVAHPWPLRARSNPTRLTTARTALVTNRHFVLERVELFAGSSWALLAGPETWILVLGGHAAIGLSAASIGQVIFVDGGRTSIEVGTGGLIALIAYPASQPIDSLLQPLGEQSGIPVGSEAPALPQFAGRTEVQA